MEMNRNDGNPSPAYPLVIGLVLFSLPVTALIINLGSMRIEKCLKGKTASRIPIPRCNHHFIRSVVQFFLQDRPCFYRGIKCVCGGQIGYPGGTHCAGVQPETTAILARSEMSGSEMCRPILSGLDWPRRLFPRLTDLRVRILSDLCASAQAGAGICFSIKGKGA